MATPPRTARACSSPARLLGTANTTIAKNTASGTGGGVYLGPNSFLSLYNSTVALNAATTSIGGVYRDGTASTDVENAIVAGNSKGNVSEIGFGTTVSSIIGGSITGLLDPAGLQSNGGPTKTIKLLSTAAAAIDDGNQTCATVPAKHRPAWPDPQQPVRHRRRGARPQRADDHRAEAALRAGSEAVRGPA